MKRFVTIIMARRKGSKLFLVSQPFVKPFENSEAARSNVLGLLSKRKMAGAAEIKIFQREVELNQLHFTL